jgi:diaminopimelate dehydrogenase
MTDKIKIAIIGYGNLGKGVECAIKHNSDTELYGIFTRRAPSSVSPLTSGVPVFSADSILEHKGKFDIAVICGGSATDLPVQTPALAENFNVIDSFDTHANIPIHFKNVDEAAKKGGNIAMISVGWDPGMFSVNRLYSECILPDGNSYTFWGKGISQGHSDAIRRIDGVIDARQYTIPIESALTAVREGKNPVLSTREKHLRECFVVAEENADKERIASEIKNMPNYFADYDTTVHFITLEELKKNHSGIPHGGFVFRTGTTGFDNTTKHVIEYSLKLESNPEFTSSVIVAFARAAVRLHREGVTGCKTVFDIPPAYLSPKSYEELLAHML